MAVIFTLEHGTYLCLVLQFGNLLVFESYQFHVSLYILIPAEELYFLRHLSCLIMFKGSFTSNHPSTVLPIFVSYVSPYSFNPPSHITLIFHFHVDDGRYIKALLR
jgi:hypothetical protein